MKKERKRKPIQFHTILISDIHFGSPMCQAEALAGFLRNIEVKYLILNGDVFEDLNFNRLQHWHWKAFGSIRKISDHCKVIWIRGNHDLMDAGFLSHLLGVKVTNQYKWQVNGRKLFATHGDRWDAYIYRYRRATELITGIYNFLRKFSSSWMRKVTRFLKKESKILLRNHEAIEKNALSLAKEKNYDAVFCGHTHRAHLVRKGNFLYGNSGTWESDSPHFLGVSNEGVSLCRYLKKNLFQIENQEWFDPQDPATENNIQYFLNEEKRAASA